MAHSLSQLKTKWKNNYSTCVICVACTNKHMQPLRIEMKPLWSRLKGFADVDCGIRRNSLFGADGKEEWSKKKQCPQRGCNCDHTSE